MKCCKECKVILPFEDFGPNKYSADGWNYKCRPCARRLARERYIIIKPAEQMRTENAVVLGVKRKEYNMTLGRRFKELKQASKLKGLGTDITLEVFAVLNNLPCNYCGGELPKSGHGLDRLNSDIGYYQQNVVPCCTACNRMKNTFTVSQFLSHIRKITLYQMNKVFTRVYKAS